MEHQQDTIIDIKESQIRYFGGAGQMLLPSPQTVAALIQQIPEHRLMTTDMMRRTLAAQFNVRGTCPVTTKKALLAIATDNSEGVAYWRVIKQNGELMRHYLGGAAHQAALLQQEGFAVEPKGKGLRVVKFRDYLVNADDG
jgi:alkylated DNA nucleotide flippase Atl1